MKSLILCLLLSITFAEQTLKFKLMGEDTHTYSDSLKKPADTESNDDLMSKFFVVGDFGDINALDNLNHVTDIMDVFSQSGNYDFIATVGDNIYENGIVSLDNLDDVNKIMNAFKKPYIQKMPMYVTLGNHDCYSDYKNEIEYSKYDDQWTMDSDYYELKVPMKDDTTKSLVLLMANSWLLDCLTAFKDENDQTDCEKMNVEEASDRVKEHYEWVETRLEKYSNDTDIAWLGIVMHHPLFIELGIKKDLLPILRKYKIDMAIVGHNHMFEYANIGFDEELKYPNDAYGPIIDNWDLNQTEIINTSSRQQIFKKGETLHQFMVGGSGRVFKNICPYRDQDGSVYFQNIKEHGMMTIEVNSKQFTAKYYEGADDLIYEIIIES